MATSPIYTSACAPVTSAEGSSANLVDTKPQQPVCYPTAPAAFTATFSQVQAPLLESSAPTTPSLTATGAPSPTLDLEKSKTSAEAQVRAEANISKDMPRAVLALKRRLDEHEAQTKRSFASVRDQLTKLTDMFSSLTNSMVLSSTSSTTTAPTPSSGSTTMAASAPSLFCVAASSPRTSGGSRFGASSSAYAAPKVFDTMPTPSSGYENFSGHSDQSPDVQDGGTNPREQNLDELPQAYGLHNLICRTVVRADGSEHSYYALSGNYPLEQDMPEPLLSNKSVGVSDSTPEQQPCEEEQQEGEQPLKCLSKKLETEHTSACVSIISEVLELQPQNDGRSRNCPALKTSDTYVTRSSQFSIVRSVTEMRLLWDPGDTTSYALFTTADSATNLQCTNVYKPAVVQILAVQFGVRRHSISIFPWDPGATEFPFVFMTSAGATELHGTNIFKSEFTCSSETQTRKLLNFLVNLKKIIPWPSGKFQLITPFKLFMELLCANPAVQVTQQLHHLEFLVMADLSLNVNKVDGQLTCKHKVSCCLQIILACPYSVPACYSRMFSSAEAIHSARSISAATTMCVLLVLSSEETAEEGKDAANVYTVSEIQLPMRKTSHACYPDGESILYSYKGLHVHKTQLVDCTSTATHACYLVPAHTPPSQISTQACSNTELGELISRCLVYHLHQITKWTSATDNVIRSIEYAYTLNYHIDQWEFFHQLCVKKYCIEKNLLSSPNYLQHLELDIIFITYLPP